MNDFPPEVVAAVTGHMNRDHAEDNALIARAFLDPDTVAAELVDVDREAGTFILTTTSGEREGRVPWARPAEDRAALRRELVGLYDTACERLGLPPREH